MSTIEIHRPETVKAYLNEQVARRGFRDASEFVQSLLEAERQRHVGREVEQLLLEAAGGPFSEWTDDDVDDIRRAGRRAIGGMS